MTMDGNGSTTCMALFGLNAIYDLTCITKQHFQRKKPVSQDGRSGTRTTSAGALVSAELIAVSMFPHR